MRLLVALSLRGHDARFQPKQLRGSGNTAGKLGDRVRRGMDPGVPIQPFDNVDLYSLMAEILKIKPAKTDGSDCAALLDLENPLASCAVPRSQA